MAVGEAPAPLLPDLVEVAVPRGGRVVVVSDLHLTTTPTDASRACTGTLVEVLEGWDGPGVLVVAGDGFEMLAEVATIDAIADAHPAWAGAVAAFAAGEGRQVVVLPGNHDGQIAWDGACVDALRRRLGASTLALAVDLVLDTGEGPRRVRVVHGNQADPYNAFVDPRDPIDTPLGHHVVRQVLPLLDAADKPGGLLQDLRWLSEPTQVGELVGSRLLYGTVGRRLWWIALPFLAIALLRLLVFLPGVGDVVDEVQGWLVALGLAVAGVVVVATVVGVATLLGVHHAVTEADVVAAPGAGGHNARARAAAAALVAGGHAGVVSGHTHQPELSVVGEGFYANSGCGVESLGPRRARGGLPRPFAASLRCSYVELEAADVLVARLTVGERPVRPGSVLERLVAKPTPDVPATPALVAELPGGGTYPVEDPRLGLWAKRRHRRRLAAALLVVGGVVNIASAFLSPTVGGLADLERWVPLRGPRVAGALAVLVGVALFGLARSVRRGYRPAWLIVITLLGIAVAAMVLKGGELEEATLNLALAVWLVLERRHFAVRPPGRRRWAPWAAAFALLGVLFAASTAATLGVGDRIPRALAALGFGLVLLVAWWATAAASGRRQRGPSPPGDRARARQVVAAHGQGTLDHLALAGDRRLLFSGDGVVAHTVRDRVMLVSPDPVCPPDQRASVWADAMAHADANGWGIAVVGAATSWLPVYHAAGLLDVVVGEEAVLDCRRFDPAADPALAPVRASLAAARGRGWAAEVVEGGDGPDPALAAELAALAAAAGRPGPAVGPGEGPVLTVVCRDGAGAAVGFTQLVPAPAVDGWSTAASCLPAGEGATAWADLAVAAAAGAVRARGQRGLSLGVVTLRGVAVGSRPGPWGRLGREVLGHLVDVEELAARARADDRYGPAWVPRHAVTDALFDAPRAGLAIARAEVAGARPARRGGPARPAP